MIDKYREISLSITVSFEDALAASQVVVDCTPGGSGVVNRDLVYSCHPHLRRLVYQGGEDACVGRGFVIGVSDYANLGKNVQVLSCNSHAIATLTMAMLVFRRGEARLKGNFFCIRRGSDLGQPDGHGTAALKIGGFSSHHAPSAMRVLRQFTPLSLSSSSAQAAHQLMHLVRFEFQFGHAIARRDVEAIFFNAPWIAQTLECQASRVFANTRFLGGTTRGLALQHTIVNKPSLVVRESDGVVQGFAFTPQESNTLASNTLAAITGLDKKFGSDVTARLCSLARPTREL